MEGDFIQRLARRLRVSNQIDPALYGKSDVKRGLRNANGSGVVVGLTRVGDVQGYTVIGRGEKIPIGGKLLYRGIDVEDIVNNCIAEDRFGYEETAYLLLFGELPDRERLCVYERLLGEKRVLPDGCGNPSI